jgi:hypothetical protein
LITLHSDSERGQIPAVAWGSVFTRRRQDLLHIADPEACERAILQLEEPG